MILDRHPVLPVLFSETDGMKVRGVLRLGLEGSGEDAFDVLHR